MKRRALHGVRLLIEGRADHLIACGGLGKYPPSEADMIRQISVEQGVFPERISLEELSRNTRENLAFALPILKAIGNPPVIIVTDSYHAPRALMIARRLGIKATASCPDPSGTGRLSRLKSSLREIPAYAADRVRPIAKP